MLSSLYANSQCLFSDENSKSCEDLQVFISCVLIEAVSIRMKKHQLSWTGFFEFETYHLALSRTICCE